MQEINQKNVRLLIPNKAAAVAVQIARKEHLSPEEGLMKFYHSKVYEQLEDEKTKLWHYSPAQLWKIGFERNISLKYQKKNGPGHSMLAPYADMILNAWQNERKSAAAIAGELANLGVATSPQNVWKFIKRRSK